MSHFQPFGLICISKPLLPRRWSNRNCVEPWLRRKTHGAWATHVWENVWKNFIRFLSQIFTSSIPELIAVRGEILNPSNIHLRQFADLQWSKKSDEYTSQGRLSFFLYRALFCKLRLRLPNFFCRSCRQGRWIDRLTICFFRVLWSDWLSYVQKTWDK